MKNKKYFIMQLCNLLKIDIDSEEAKKFSDMMVVDLLIEIKYAKNAIEDDNNDDDDDTTIGNIAGCRY